MLRRLTLIIILLLTLSGCTQLFFQPSQGYLITPDQLGLSYQEIIFNSPDGLELHGWWLPSVGEAHATVLFLHGNAQNISNHLGSVYWLPKEGVNLFIVDYRGYGQSEGVPSLPGAMLDIEAALQQALTLTDNTPLVVVSHSLGASMAIHALAESPNKSSLSGAIFAAPFSDYRQVVREVVAKVWFLWLFQYPLSWSINNDFAPIESVARLAPLPLLFLHSSADTIIIPRHSEQLFAVAREPKQLQLLKGGHNELFTPQENRQLILDTIYRWSNRILITTNH
ncbi:MAG: lysophospholipase [Gammaproteobacteria bacterium]|nr:lysophospholipase [Gammaproteobacteria bacterium]